MRFPERPWMMWTEFRCGIDSVLFGSLFTLRAKNKTVTKRIHECRDEQFSNDNRLEHSKSDLDSMLTFSVRRLERIENKAMGTLLGVSVAIAVFGATSGLLGSNGALAGSCYGLRIVAAALLLLTMLYLLGSGFLALGAYKIGEVFRPTLSDCAPIVEKQKEKSVMLYCIEQNQRAATLRANRLSASFACLRNGLLTILLLDILIILAGVLQEAMCGA